MPSTLLLCLLLFKKKKPTLWNILKTIMHKVNFIKQNDNIEDKTKKKKQFKSKKDLK